MKITSTRFLNLNLALALNLFKGSRFIGNSPFKKVTPQYYEASLKYSYCGKVQDFFALHKKPNALLLNILLIITKFSKWVHS